MKNIHSKVKAFTLVETIVSIGIIVFAIAGPLGIAVHSSSYTRDSKNQITSTYLAQEAVELLRLHRDTLFIQCTNSSVPVGNCTAIEIIAGSGNYETPGETAWRLFKAKIGGANKCFVAANPLGCSYDVYSFVSDPINPTSRIFNATSASCNTLYSDNRAGVAVTKGMYLCKAHADLVSVGSFSTTTFSRVIKITSVPAVGSGTYDPLYNDDLRVDVSISYRKQNGFVKTFKVIDFIRAKV